MASIYMYKGGGYKGCFWECNYCYVDGDKFVDLYSSGYRAIKSLEKLTEYIKDVEESKVSRDWYTEYNLDDEDDRNTLVDESLTYLHLIYHSLEQNNIEVELKYVCNECDRRIDINEGYEITDYTGNGGAGIEVHGVTCLECLSDNNE